jgi:hypothetical protein
VVSPRTLGHPPEALGYTGYWVGLVA